MNEETIKRLHDARTAAADIVSFTTSRSLDDYLEDYQLRLAIERLITIVGEAMGAAMREEPALKQRIPDAVPANVIRNRIVHGYDSVDDEIIWSTATVSIPVLVEQIAYVLREENR